MSAGVLAKRGLLLAITGVSLYLLAPALLEVFGAFDRLDDFNPLWWIAMVLLQLGSYACMWELQRISMRAERRAPVITSQLASNAFGRVVPGGVAAAGAMQYAMLTRGGGPAGRAAGRAVRRPGRSRPGQGRPDRRSDVRAAVRRRRRGDPVGPPAGAGGARGADGPQPHSPEKAAADRAARPAAPRAQQRDDGARPALVAGAVAGRGALAARLPDALGGPDRGARRP